MESAPLLEACGLACERGDRILFENLHFSVPAGAMLHIEGRNGAGKTSLLRILCGLAQPMAGTVHWRGRSVGRWREAFLAEVSYVGHHHGVKGSLTPEENLAVARGLAIAHPTVDIAETLRCVGLAAYCDHPCQELSAGQRRRVALARLLAVRTSLWILDEPLTSLDRAGVRMVEGMLHTHLAAGGAVVVVTHHPLQLDGMPVQRISLDR